MDVDVEETAAKKKKNKKKKKKAGDAADADGDDADEPMPAPAAPSAAPVPAVQPGGYPAPAAPAGEDDDEDGDDGEGAAGAKKKKKKKKKGGGAAAGGGDGGKEQDNSALRRVGNWKERVTIQTSPPTVPITQCFPNEQYPVGEIQHYVGKNASRITSAEKKAQEALTEGELKNLRRASECHREVRKFVQSYAKPGMKMVDFCQTLERKTHELIQVNGLEAGWGFPTGCSLNYVAAHYTPNYGDDTVLQYDDVCKLDFGVQVGGRIIDSAFTIAFNPRYDELIKATQDGTNTGIKEAGIDARFSEIGAAIQETIESYEIELDGKTFPIKPVRNLNGHTLTNYVIHAGKSLPIVKTNDSSIMEEGEQYAVETFASTGKGYVVEDLDCSHYMKIYNAPAVPLRLKSAKELLHTIDKNFSTLAFCRRWLDDLGATRHLMALKSLVDNDLVQSYPPLCDVRGSYVSQMEHTIFLRPTCKEVLSRGDDY